MCIPHDPEAASLTECGNGFLKVQVECQLEGSRLTRRGWGHPVKSETPYDAVSPRKGKPSGIRGSRRGLACH